MPAIDLLIRGGTAVLPSGERKIALAVDQGKVVGHDETEAKNVVEAAGLLILPGAVDAHVHYNEPGREDWEGWKTGSRASRAGGATSVVEMPLNALPPTLDAETFQKKRAVAEKKSCVDFALWGGITPLNLKKLEELGHAGAIGFKAFMIDSGTADFPGSDPATLKQGMATAAKLGLPVSVHAESPGPIRQRTEEIRKKGGTSVRDYLSSRPIETELEAIRLVCELAGETRSRIHIVHVSCPEGIEEIQKARQRGVDVTAETCPHYLVLTDEDMVRLGPPAKCAPPLRSAAAREGLLQKVHEGKVSTIGSDHSPAPGSMKADPDFFKVWGGIAGCQHLVPLLFSAGLSPVEIARLTAENPARRLGLYPRKGSLEIGSDADFILVRPGVTEEVRVQDLLTTHPITPYLGMKLPARVEQVAVRGSLQPVAGKFLFPSSSA
jgi:allantoinase